MSAILINVRILFSTYTTAFQNPGGGENVIFQLRNELRKNGHTVELYHPCKYHVSDFDVFHHFSMVDSDVWSHLKKNHPRIPIVVTPTIFMRGGLIQQALWKLHLVGEALERIALELNPNILRDIDSWLPSTDYESEQLNKYYGISKEKIKVLRNGVDVAFKNTDSSFFHQRCDIKEPFVLHVGRFHPVKNQLNLIRASAKLNLPTVFIGGADDNFREYRSQCVSEAEKLNKNIFRFFDHEPYASDFLKSAYSAARMFALPSFFETYGIAALEALMAGKPCVITENVADRNLFSNAIFVNPKSVEDISAGLKKCLDNPPKIDNGEMKKILQENSWENISAELISHYKKLVNG